MKPDVISKIVTGCLTKDVLARIPKVPRGSSAVAKEYAQKTVMADLLSHCFEEAKRQLKRELTTKEKDQLFEKVKKKLIPRK